MIGFTRATLVTWAALASVCNASSEPTRSYGTVDSFGLLRWERFSANPAVGQIVTALAKETPSFADLRMADEAVARKPDDLPSRALRAELRLRTDPSAPHLPAPTFQQLVGLKKADRFEKSYLYYHRRRLEFPERYGITTGLQKATPPYTIYNQHDLVTIAISGGLGSMAPAEDLLALDWALRFGRTEDARKLVRNQQSKNPSLWQFDALSALAQRYGGRYTTPGAKVDLDWVRRPDQALTIAQRLIKAHSECRILYQLAGVAAMDLKKSELARAYFLAYLANPDPGIQGERRSKDVRELLAKLPKG